MPSVTMRAARVTVFSSMPKAWYRPSDVNMVMGMVDAATNATRIGSRSITTRTTATIAMTISCRKLMTLSPTTLLWSVMRLMLTSCGSVCWNFSIAWSIALPISTTFSPFFISTLRSRHFLPLLVMRLSASGYSRLTVAMSFSRTFSPPGEL